MASGTTYEHKMESIVLTKHAARSDRKQRCLYYDAANKVKRNWSDNNYLKLTAQPHNKHFKCADVNEFVEEIVTSYWDNGEMLS